MPSSKGPTMPEAMRHISFGALKAAQDSLEQEKLTSQKPASEASDGDLSSDSDSSASDEDEEESPSDGPPRKKSKHAPVMLTSKKPVTRKRTVISMPKIKSRDPRFLPLGRSASAQPNPYSRNGYAFLHEYETAELDELRAEAKKYTGAERETIQRKIDSLSNRIKAREMKEREREVIRRNKQQEKARIKEGKTPFYLKKKDIKKQVLEDQFKSMKSRDREKAVKKRRVRQAQKELKRRPTERRKDRS
ncbi:DUF947-domain-containing protein [Piedraia hortae CBS 480.64]|uniref:rRNA biogenesis protein RRP36 n=1 Tax=Piedraia hortae CBS 480.64 TaxID=1314780 RepID=A0A6A7BTK2_9PEZI|nr:DUF947-domain-containing protein [Piedraia hortae CBS 480.64]